VRDPYRWLEDEKSPEVQAWMTAEDTFARAALAKLPGRDDIAARVRALLYVESRSPPAKYGHRYFYSRHTAAQEKPTVVYVLDGKEHIALDANAWPAEQHQALHDWTPSWDGKKLAYTVALNNADEATLHVLDVDTGRVSDIDVLPGSVGSISFTPASDALYYMRAPTGPTLNESEKAAAAELVRHKLGDAPAHDVVMHERTGDPQLGLDGAVSRDGHWLIVQVGHGSSGNMDTYVRDLRRGGSSDWQPLAVDTHGHYLVGSYKDRFYVWTDDGAPHGHMFVVSAGKLDRASWKEIVPERSDATLQGFSIVGGALSLAYLKDVVNHLETRRLDGSLVREIALPGLGAASVLAGDKDDDEAYYTFTSFTHPTEIYKTSVKTGVSSLWYREPVPVDSAKYVVEQKFYESKDKTRVPMFIVHAKDWTPEKGTVPTLLYGYGGFDISLQPWFDPSIFPWLERGGAYAVANIRGGAEYGEAWHLGGKLHEKQNVFDDFIAAAESLVAWGYTSKDKLVAEGESNGGLLMGAMATQRPDLFHVVLCGVPLLDMIRFPKFGGGQFWVDEYGSPEKEDDFRALLAYSPYHHVEKGTRYPSLLMMSSDSDDRVDPMHARKFIAALQAATTGGPALLRIERNAGHGGNDTRKAWVDSIADKYAFALAEIAAPGSVLNALTPPGSPGATPAPRAAP
jgi:prolyl oligopeptidase